VELKPKSTDQTPSFEEAIGQLETIVESIEAGEIPLFALLAKFEEGTRLLNICETYLKSAEMKIETLKTQNPGMFVFEPFPASAALKDD
jgi:exodeoxyribonuclease VII small subunit